MRVILLWLISLSLLLHGSEAVSLPLNDGWTLVNHNKSIQLQDISIPSGVYSDLEQANITESVLFSYNDVKLRWIAYENWTYALNFSLSADDLNHENVILTFNGIDTIATILVNGERIGSTNNMFVRYRFDVKDHLVMGPNELTVEFTSPVLAAKDVNTTLHRWVPPECPPEMYNGECHMNLLRKMQASFAWDWGLAAPSMGIWKDVSIDIYDSIVIRDITYKLIDGPIDEEESNPEIWSLKVFVHMEAGVSEKEFDGVMTCELMDVRNSTVFHKVQVKTDEFGEFTTEIEMVISKSSVALWWPNGYGKQSLYGLQIKWEDSKVNEVSSYNRTFFITSRTVDIGFRTVELVQETMQNGKSFYFKVNDIPMFMKGSNWIPSHILPESSYSKDKVKELLLATRDANMNMLRVWGGGVYESDYFYSLADQYGILIWQDMMFACAMYPANAEFLNTVRMETKQQVKRIQHHPSIAIFATNNENEAALRQDWYKTNRRFQDFAIDYRKLYVDTITDEINKNDPSRVVLTSSPSNGNYGERDRFGIGIDPQDPHYGDIHFYVVDQNAWQSKSFHQSRFTSEYGFQSFPSGWSEVMREGDNLTDLIDHRQHHPLKSHPITFLVEKNLDLHFDSLPWDDKIYLSQLSQAMAMKTETEVYRSGRGTFMNTMGALYWQLNDVWVAPSWSSIEYNGNYKILHHWIKDIFAPQTVIVQMDLLKKVHIFVISDEINVDPKPVTVKMNLRRWNDFSVTNSVEWNCTMRTNDAQLIDDYDLLDYMNVSKFEVNEFIAEFLLIDNKPGRTENIGDRLLSRSFIFPGSFKELKSVGDPKPKLSIAAHSCQRGKHQMSLEITIKKPAIFMSVSLVHDVIKKFHFSKDGFIQFEPINVIDVTFENPDCAHEITANDFVVKTLNQFIN